MPTAELISPRRLNMQGRRIFERGVETPVDLKTALILDENPRFKVRGLADADPDAVKAAREAIAREDNTDAIIEANDGLDLDVEANWDANGRPTAAAISAVLGYEVTQEAVNKALGQAARIPEARVEVEEPRVRTKVAVKVKTKAPETHLEV